MEEENGGRMSEVRDRAKESIRKADFRKILALIIIAGGGAYLWEKADVNQVVPYLYGLISTAVGFYFHTTKSSQDKSQKIDELTKK